MKKVIVTSMVFGAIILSSTAQANPCLSQWQKATASIKKLEKPAAQIICSAVGSISSAGDAKKCIQMYEKGRSEAERLTRTWNNANDGSGKIGPRGCAMNVPYYGNVKAERTFNCKPSARRNVTVDFKVTGGKAKKPLTVDVCFVNSKGVPQHHHKATFKSAKKALNKGFKKTFKGKAGLIPMVYLHKPLGINGYKYKLKVTENGQLPAVVTKAKKLIK